MSQIDFLVKMRDAACMIEDACDEQLEKLAPPGAKQTSAAVKEETFNILKWDPQEGAKIGAYDVAYKATNLPDKWNQAYNILRQNNAVINARYHGEGYVYAYWLYGEDKIYRQKLKQK
jgi:hypothetical protein